MSRHFQQEHKGVSETSMHSPDTPSQKGEHPTASSISLTRRLSPADHDPARILALQRAVGNRAVQRTLSANISQSSVQQTSGISLKEVPHQVTVMRTDQKDASSAHALIVEDSAADLTPGQVKKSEFMEQLYQALYKVGTEEYQGTNLTVKGCPYLIYWFDYYGKQAGSHVERAIRKYASAPARVVTVEELILLVCQRARKGFQSQVQTGKITEIPDDVPASVGEGIVPKPELIEQAQGASQNPSTQQSIQRIQLQRNQEPPVAIQRGCLSNPKDSQEAGKAQANTNMVWVSQNDYAELQPGQTANPMFVSTCTLVYVRSTGSRVVIYHWPATSLDVPSKAKMREAVESIDAIGKIAAMQIYTKSPVGIDEFVTYLRETYGVPVTTNMAKMGDSGPGVRYDGTWWG